MGIKPGYELKSVVSIQLDSLLLMLIIMVLMVSGVFSPSKVRIYWHIPLLSEVRANIIALQHAAKILGVTEK